MKTHYHLTDLELEKQLEYGLLDPKIFNHEAHLRLAWIHINKYGVEKACRNMCTQISNFSEPVGESEKFNKTLTIAAVNAVHHFIQKSKSNTFRGFIREFPRLKNDFRGLISAHYRIDIFNSEIAKKEYLEPDLQPFE